MRNRLIAIVIASLSTIIVLLVMVFYITGMHSKPVRVLSVVSPNGLYEAYVIENPSFDPPNQSLFISKIGGNEFRLVSELPEDIEMISNIYWSPCSRFVAFATNWHLLVTNIESFYTMKYSVNPSWWVMHQGKGTFTSGSARVEYLHVHFLQSDSLEYQTSLMDEPARVCLKGI